MRRFLLLTRVQNTVQRPEGSSPSRPTISSPSGGLLCAANAVFVVRFVKTAFRRLAQDCLVRPRSHQRDYTHSQE